MQDCLTWCAVNLTRQRRSRREEGEEDVSTNLEGLPNCAQNTMNSCMYKPGNLNSQFFTGDF